MRDRQRAAGKVYRGERTIDGIAVTVDGRPLDEARLVRTFTRNGFEWGYEGAEPMQLALAILADHCGDPQRALAGCAAFMRAVAANLGNDWEMTSGDVEAALAALEPADR